MACQFPKGKSDPRELIESSLDYAFDSDVSRRIINTVNTATWWLSTLELTIEEYFLWYTNEDVQDAQNVYNGSLVGVKKTLNEADISWAEEARRRASDAFTNKSSTNKNRWKNKYSSAYDGLNILIKRIESDPSYSSNSYLVDIVKGIRKKLAAAKKIVKDEKNTSSTKYKEAAKELYKTASAATSWFPHLLSHLDQDKYEKPFRDAYEWDYENFYDTFGWRGSIPTAAIQTMAPLFTNGAVKRKGVAKRLWMAISMATKIKLSAYIIAPVAIVSSFTWVLPLGIMTVMIQATINGMQRRKVYGSRVKQSLYGSNGVMEIARAITYQHNSDPLETMSTAKKIATAPWRFIAERAGQGITVSSLSEAGEALSQGLSAPEMFFMSDAILAVIADTIAPLYNSDISREDNIKYIIKHLTSPAGSAMMGRIVEESNRKVGQFMYDGGWELGGWIMAKWSNFFGQWWRAYFRNTIKEMFGYKNRNMVIREMERNNPDAFNLVKNNLIKSTHGAFFISYMAQAFIWWSRLERLLGDDDDDEDENIFDRMFDHVFGIGMNIGVPLGSFSEGRIIKWLLEYGFLWAGILTDNEEELRVLQELADAHNVTLEEVALAQTMKDAMRNLLSWHQFYLRKFSPLIKEGIESMDGDEVTGDIMQWLLDTVESVFRWYDNYIQGDLMWYIDIGQEIPMSDSLLYNMVRGEQTSNLGQFKNAYNTTAWYIKFLDDPNGWGIISPFVYAVQKGTVHDTYLGKYAYAEFADTEWLVEVINGDMEWMEDIINHNAEIEFNEEGEIVNNRSLALNDNSQIMWVNQVTRLNNYAYKDGKYTKQYFSESDQEWKEWDSPEREIVVERVRDKMWDEVAEELQNNMNTLAAEFDPADDDTKYNDEMWVKMAAIQGILEQSVAITDDTSEDIPQVGRLILWLLVSEMSTKIATEKFGWPYDLTEDQWNEVKADAGRLAFPFLRQVAPDIWKDVVVTEIANRMPESIREEYIDTWEENKIPYFKKGINNTVINNVLLAKRDIHMGNLDWYAYINSINQWLSYRPATNTGDKKADQEYADRAKFDALVMVVQAAKADGRSDIEIGQAVAATVLDDKDLRQRIYESDKFSDEEKHFLDNELYGVAILAWEQDFDVESVEWLTDILDTEAYTSDTIGDAIKRAAALIDGNGEWEWWWSWWSWWKDFTDWYNDYDQNKPKYYRTNYNPSQQPQYKWWEKNLWSTRARFQTQTTSHYPTLDRTGSGRSVLRTQNTKAKQLTNTNNSTMTKWQIRAMMIGNVVTQITPPRAKG